MWHRVRLVRSKQGGSKGWFRSILAPLGFSVTLKRGTGTHSGAVCCRTAKVAFLPWKKILFFFFFSMEKLLFHTQYVEKGIEEGKKNTLQNPSFSLPLAKAATKLQIIRASCCRGSLRNFGVMKVTHWVHGCVQIP